MIAYVDSSVLLRVILCQAHSLRELESFEQRLTSLVTEVECLRAVDRMRLRGELDEDEVLVRRREVFAQLARMQKVLPSRSILGRAGGAAYPLVLKSLDAIHLATALSWRDRRAHELVFATHDVGLARAAAAVGLKVIGI